MKVYVTFGQAHVHRVNEQTFDCNSVAEIECDSYRHGREIAFKYFGEVWAFAYQSIDDVGLQYYPRGVIPVN